MSMFLTFTEAGVRRYQVLVDDVVPDSMRKYCADLVSIRLNTETARMSRSELIDMWSKGEMKADDHGQSCKVLKGQKCADRDPCKRTGCVKLRDPELVASVREYPPV